MKIGDLLTIKGRMMALKVVEPETITLTTGDFIGTFPLEKRHKVIKPGEYEITAIDDAIATIDYNGIGVKVDPEYEKVGEVIEQ